MRQTLFYIPPQLGGLPVFGLGILFAMWAVASLVLLAVLVRRQGFNRDTLGYLPLLGLIGLVVLYVLPNLLEPEGLPVRGYGVMLLLGVGSAIGLAVYRARRLGLDPEMIYGLAFWLFIMGILGARMFYVIEYWSQYQRDNLLDTLKGMINITQGGLVVYGSLFGGGLALWLFVRKHYLPGLALADLIAPSVMLGVALGRIGCFFNGCCFGGVCDLPWAVQFPAPSPPFIQQFEQQQIFLHGLKVVEGGGGGALVADVEPHSAAAERGIKRGDRLLLIQGQPTPHAQDAERVLLGVTQPGEEISIMTAGSPVLKHWKLPPQREWTLPIHPAQLYSTLDGLLICLFLLAYTPFRRRDGEVLALLMTIYPVTRFLIEIIRTDEAAVFHTQLSISQNVSLVVLLAAAGLWFYLSRQPRGCTWNDAQRPQPAG
jgi:phosphatidylglycerol:prolipoprotein diacylglycerol transferase